MKKYVNISEHAIIYMGCTADIKAMYKSIARAYHKYNTDLIPLFSEMPKFSENKMVYGIVISKPFYFVITSDDFAARLLKGDLVEVKEEKD